MRERVGSEAPSVRWAGHTKRPFAVSGVAIDSAWSIWPCATSPAVTTPAIIDVDEAVTFQLWRL